MFCGEPRAAYELLEAALFGQMVDSSSLAVLRALLSGSVLGFQNREMADLLEKAVVQRAGLLSPFARALVLGNLAVRLPPDEFCRVAVRTESNIPEMDSPLARRVAYAILGIVPSLFDRVVKRIEKDPSPTVRGLLAMTEQGRVQMPRRLQSFVGPVGRRGSKWGELDMMLLTTWFSV